MYITNLTLNIFLNHLQKPKTRIVFGCIFLLFILKHEEKNNFTIVIKNWFITFF
jgi:hypothetical protein